MRILQIRFKNLNSLAGEWSIDLTARAFAADGIFAITGPTGAGKSTILDAVCLALYGRTPRLNKISKSGNEIMSRRTGECFAEVTFATPAGKFRCHWSQHRARKKAGGELQAPRQEIVDAETGVLRETKIRGVAEQIEAATGMDFDRFTRSMLLAQGNFAKFLRAPADDRANILEQITGTEIYGKISVRVHERQSRERSALKALADRLEGLRPLSAEEVGQLAAELEQRKTEDEELSDRLRQKNAAAAWREGMEGLQRELGELEGRKADLGPKLAAFAPQRERLRLARQALEFAGAYAELTVIRAERKRDAEALEECRKEEPGRADAALRADAAANAAARRLRERRTERQDAMRPLREVRALDLRIGAQEKSIAAARQAAEQCSASVEALRKRVTEDSEALAELGAAVKISEGELASTRVDAGLVSELAGIRGRFENARSLSVQLGEKREAAGRAAAEAKTSKRICGECGRLFAAAVREREGAAERLEKEQSALREALAGREVAAWRQERDRLAAEGALLGATRAAVESRAQARSSLEAIEAERQEILASRSRLDGQLAVRQERLKGLEEKTELLERQVGLFRRIRSYEEARGQLKEGEPCPLCGATGHPFVGAAAPVVDAVQAELNATRAERRTTESAIGKLREASVRSEKDLERLAADAGKREADREAADHAIGENCARLGIASEPGDGDARLDVVLAERAAANARRLESVDGVLARADALLEESTKLRDALERVRREADERERAFRDAGHGRDSAAETAKRLQGEAKQGEDRLREALASLREELRPFGIGDLGVENLAGIFVELTRRRDAWIERDDRHADLRRRAVALEADVRHETENLQAREKAFGDAGARLNELLRDGEELRRNRGEIFGDKNADAEERRLSDAVDAAESAAETERRKKSLADQDLGRLRERIVELEKTLDERTGKSQAMAEAFRRKLSAGGFADEERYRAACLPEEERRRLEESALRLANEEKELEVALRERTARFESERAKRLAEEPLADLLAAAGMLREKQKEVQRRIGGLRQKLADNAEIKLRQQKWVAAMRAQETECARWDGLHQLIGSADGKKYRNFAQGLTFEVLIVHANRQLRKLTDRYLLVRDAAQPLELEVIDNYQAGEIRSTKNLSGGESFIVSLALALGLSRMASKNVCVDSLFLDEGFDTLDEETLNTVLDTLAGLRQSGKLIGVISHVSALKERIGAQIQVTPQAGGRSRISGPGCARHG